MTAIAIAMALLPDCSWVADGKLHTVEIGACCRVRDGGLTVEQITVPFVARRMQDEPLAWPPAGEPPGKLYWYYAPVEPSGCFALPDAA